MRRVLIAVLAWFLLCTSAYAEADIYIWNPLPEQRLHLRVSPSRDAESLYGIPTSTAARNTILYLDPELTISAQTVAANQSIEILGLVNDEVLHVRLNDTYGFMRWINTRYTDPK